MAGTRIMESRTGRAKQRECSSPRAARLEVHPPDAVVLTDRCYLGYGTDGERLVAGVVPLNEARTHILMIESTRRNGWVLPKGGWEDDEECTEAAQREAWEEAGIICTVDYDLGQITETRTAKQISKNSPRALYQFYQVTVTREEDEWPEKHKRSRKWVTYAEAKHELQARPELLQALERSTIQR